MAEFFHARITEEQRYQAGRAPFRRKYFADDCRYDSHVGTLERMESEKIASIDERECDSTVITEQTFRYSGGTKRIRFRYQLQVSNDDWLIRAVQTACYICDGRGDTNCPCCKGKRWVGAEQGKG